MNTEKLTIEHLAPYFPYGLKGKYEHSYNPYQGQWKLTGIETDDIKIVKDNFSLWIRSENFKPLLFHLSDLPESMCNYYGYTFEAFSQMCTDILDRRVPCLFMDEIIEGHYDAYGLLDKGLALNKLDYEH